LQHLPPLHFPDRQPELLVQAPPSAILQSAQKLFPCSFVVLPDGQDLHVPSDELTYCPLTQSAQFPLLLHWPPVGHDSTTSWLIQQRVMHVQLERLVHLSL
jgi:hypothetical protein